MEGISRYLRLRTCASAAALLGAVVVAIALSGSAHAKSYANDISLRVVNNTKHSISAAFCPNGHVSIQYQFGTRANPCNVTPFTTTLAAHGGRYPEGPWPKNPKPYAANPVGVVIKTGRGQTLYFYASNPRIGKPFFEGNGKKVTMVEGELATRSVDGVVVRYHREGDINGGLNDPSYKVMTIEICGATQANCR